MTHPQTPLCKRTIRWHQLRQIVSLADTTIYDMEQRGEFPHRFCLTSRCVVEGLAGCVLWPCDVDEARRVAPWRSLSS
ncbi:AlpA family phage regulatory protein [Rhizobium sp. L245/93]|nr:AlpA family phage regulatory protein [Rhizobium sp. L245/93]